MKNLFIQLKHSPRIIRVDIKDILYFKLRKHLEGFKSFIIFNNDGIVREVEFTPLTPFFQTKLKNNFAMINDKIIINLDNLTEIDKEVLVFKTHPLFVPSKDKNKIFKYINYFIDESKSSHRANMPSYR